MPLGLGPHVCIGKALSTILITSIIAQILIDYTVDTESDQSDLPIEAGIVIRPSERVLLHVSRRQFAEETVGQ
jgi:cytochrome P450